MLRQKTHDEVDVRRAAILSVSTETFEVDQTPTTGRPGYITDVKVSTFLGATSAAPRQVWDPAKERFVVPKYDEPEPEPEAVEEIEDIVEEEEEVPAIEGAPRSKVKKKPKKKKKKRRKIAPEGSPNVVYAKPRTIKKS